MKMVSFSAIKILIIEDELNVAEHIKDGILKLKDYLRSKYNITYTPDYFEKS